MQKKGKVIVALCIAHFNQEIPVIVLLWEQSGEKRKSTLIQFQGFTYRGTIKKIVTRLYVYSNLTGNFFFAKYMKKADWHDELKMMIQTLFKQKQSCHGSRTYSTWDLRCIRILEISMRRQRDTRKCKTRTWHRIPQCSTGV